MYDALAAGMTKTQMIHIVIERCDRRDALANLEAALRAERREQYEKRFGPPAGDYSGRDEFNPWNSATSTNRVPLCSSG